MTNTTNTMSTIYVLCDENFTIATLEIFETFQEAENKVQELKLKAIKGTRFFIEVR